MNLALVFEQGDGILITVFLLLVLMSILTWSIIIIRSVKLLAAKNANKKADALIWSASSLQEAQTKVADIRSPISDLAIASIEAKEKYFAHHEQQLAADVPLNEYLIRQMRSSMSQIMRRFDHGLTALASIGATAPFIGLFGTVWGIYHALINISTSGQMSIAAVAGPIGEALVATAAGLFVAIPAVLAYNALVRSKKTLSQDLDGFAHDFHVQLLNSKV